MLRGAQSIVSLWRPTERHDQAEHRSGGTPKLLEMLPALHFDHEFENP
jgi:hypothetical protein